MPLIKTVTTINGRFVRRGQDKISVFDNALLYADGLFETILAIGNHLVFMKEHLQRLHQCARLIDIKLPVSDDRLISWMKRTVKAHLADTTKLRLTITSGEAARWVGTQGKPQVILSASPHQVPEAPFSLYVSEFRVDQDSEFRRIKTLSYAIHAAALKTAYAKDCDDALLLNEKDQVAEVTTANIFWVRNGRIYTPPIESGCLRGITRRIVIREARRLGSNVTERNISLDKLSEADEIFISSSLKMVIPVSRIKHGRRVFRIKSGPIGQLFCSHFRNMVGLPTL